MRLAPNASSPASLSRRRSRFPPLPVTAAARSGGRRVHPGHPESLLARQGRRRRIHRFGASPSPASSADFGQAQIRRLLCSASERLMKRPLTNRTGRVYVPIGILSREVIGLFYEPLGPGISLKKSNFNSSNLRPLVRPNVTYCPYAS